MKINLAINDYRGNNISYRVSKKFTILTLFVMGLNRLSPKCTAYNLQVIAENHFVYELHASQNIVQDRGM